MRRLPAAALAGLLGLGVTLGTAAPAVASVRGRIVSVEAKNGTLQVVFSAVGLGESDTIDQSSVRLQLNGAPLTARVSGTGGVGVPAVDRRVMLAIDTSGSMAGARLAAARQAATAYLARVPADVKVGLVTFSTTASLAVAPTTNRAAVRSALARVRATGNTALFDAVFLSVVRLGPTGSRSILLLSDGQDDGSKRTFAADQAALQHWKVSLDGVLLGTAGAKQSLTALSNTAGGRVVSAQAATDLTATFEKAARSSDKDVLIVATIPKGYDNRSASVTVNATAGGQDVSDTAIAINLTSGVTNPVAFGPRPVQPLTGALSHTSIAYLGLFALFVGLAGLLAYAFNFVATRPESMRGRLRPFVDTSGKKAQEPEHTRSVRETAFGLADDIVKKRGLEEVLARKLDAGGVPLKPAEWLMVHIGIAIVLPLLVLLLTNLNGVLTLVALGVGVFGPLGYLTFKARKRTSAFLAQLPDTLQLLSGSLSAGYSLPQALDAVVRQGNPPIADELRKALVEARLGAPIEDSLDDVADRMDSKDFRWVVMAIRIQRQVGGNLAEVLATTAATLRERERLRRQVDVLSAEGKLSAYILFGLPVVFAIYMFAVRPQYVKPLYTDPIGITMLIGMFILLAVGAFWLKKVVTVEV